jgi:hypothetical protein
VRGCERAREFEGEMESFFSVQLMVDAAREEQKKQLEYVLVAQRCAGITAHIIENGCIRIRFETSYKGELARMEGL